MDFVGVMHLKDEDSMFNSSLFLMIFQCFGAIFFSFFLRGLKMYF